MADSTSRTVRPTALGSPDVLAVAVGPTPAPGPGEVLVRVRAAGVNPIDWKLYSGAFHAVDDEHRSDAGLAEADLPRLGLEAAGVVEVLGPDAVGVSVDDEVIVYPVVGAYADHVVVPVASLVPKPAGLGWTEAGSLMLAGLTAVHALTAAAVGEGDRVLVHGASGGVGLMALQLARLRGASVVATAAPRNHDLLRELGAEPIAYGEGLLDRVLAVEPDGPTAALDLVGTDEALDVSLALVPDRSRIASIAGGPRRAETGIHVIGNAPGQDAGTEIRSAARPDLATWAGDGSVRVVVAATYPLDEAPQAHRDGIAGHSAGKLVLLP